MDTHGHTWHTRTHTAGQGSHQRVRHPGPPVPTAHRGQAPVLHCRPVIITHNPTIRTHTVQATAAQPHRPCLQPPSPAPHPTPTHPTATRQNKSRLRQQKAMVHVCALRESGGVSSCFSWHCWQLRLAAAPHWGAYRTGAPASPLPTHPAATRQNKSRLRQQKGMAHVRALRESGGVSSGCLEVWLKVQHHEP